MAITIKSFPQASGYVSANEEVWHVADSTNKAVIGMKYIFDIYKGANLQTRIANSPYGADSYGVLNVGSIARAGVVVSNLGDLDMTSAYNTNYGVLTAGADYWFTEYDVRYGEICGTTTTADMASGTYRVYNTYNRHPIHRSGAALSSGTVFLTNRPNISNTYNGEPVVLSINGKRATLGGEISVDTNGGEVSFSAIDGFHYFSLNSLDQDALVSIFINDAVVGTRTIKSKCSKYTPFTLVFLNSYGAWDSFTFVNGNILTDNEKKKYERERWQLSGFNMVDKTGKVRYEGMKTYGVKFNTKMKLTTDILNSEEYKWLFELMVSPLVYLWDKTNSLFHPVQITDSNYEIKNSLQNKTETLEVNIDVFNQNTQFR